MASKSVTRPEDLASQIGVSGKVVRAYLRKTFTRPASAKGSTWILTPAQVTSTRKHFKSLQASDTPKRNVTRKTSKPKASGVTVTKRKPTVKAGTRAKVTAPLDPNADANGQRVTD